SRYTVERWMREHVRQDDLVGISGLPELLPRFNVPYAHIGSLAELQEAHPAFYVLNADYAHSVPRDSAWGQLIFGLEGETAGYGAAYRLRRIPPWPWLPGAHPALAPVRLENEVFWASILRDINPTIEVF